MFRKNVFGFLTSLVLISVLMIQSVVAAVTPASDSVKVEKLSSDSIDYDSYTEQFSESYKNDAEIIKDLNIKLNSAEQIFDVEVLQDGMYILDLKYKAVNEGTSNLVLSLKIDGKYPFSEAKSLSFPRFWSVDEVRVDGLGNEFSPEAVPAEDFMECSALDASGWSADEYRFYLGAGHHSVSLAMSDGEMELNTLRFRSVVSEFKATDSNVSDYSGEPVVIEAEKPYLLGSFWLIPKSDNTSATVTPASTSTNKVNYIGGNWKSAGETIYWKANIEKSGYYQIGFSYRQSGVLNGSSYRTLKTDGICPFEAAEAIPFKYSTKWQNSVFSSEKDDPYKIYLSAGEHIISLTATPGPIAEISKNLKNIVAELGNLYMDITMITGETIDNYRDYDLFDKVSKMESRITACLKGLSNASDDLADLGKQGSGSYDSTIKSMMQTLQKMLDNKYTAHRYVSDYYSKYCSLASALNEMREMPLDLDRIILSSPKEEMKFNKVSPWEQFVFSTRKFFTSFIGDYNNVSGVKNAKDHLTIWVNWGRDQAQILNSLIQSDFTPKYNMPVDVKVTNATIVQSVLSGSQPDVILQQPRSEPVNLAIRGVLLDLCEFDDLDETLQKFHSGAEIPYKYKDGLYALPDTQTFNLMFYRTDIFKDLGLTVPKTWDEFSTVCRLLARNNLQAWLPYTQITTTTQVNTGIGSLTLFPCLLLQNGLSLYSENGRSSNFSNTEVIKIFEFWTDYYTKMKLPVTMNFYNRFRTGTCPLGISQYTTYTTLKAAAPEIEGLWAVTSIPSVKREDGSLNQTSSGGGTGCCILKSTKNKMASWNFLKWWTDENTQLKYNNNLESVLGPTGRIAVSNRSALSRLSWDSSMKEEILSAWEDVEEIPEVPGSYYASRAVDLSFWNVVNENLNPKDVLLKWSTEVDNEIERKWKQYENRK